MKLPAKKSYSVADLRARISDQRSTRGENKTTNVFCDECRFVNRNNARVKFIRDLETKRTVCEVCFEKLQISDWEFAEITRENL